MMTILTIWIVVAIVAAIIARNKGRSVFGWFLLCLFLTPLAVLILVVLPSRKTVEAQLVRIVSEGSTKICPQCAETVQAAAKICRFCRFEFPQ
jgi:hypothetical protein